MADAGEGVEVWRGGVEAWECDQMGHMSVRFYIARAQEGLAGFAAALGLIEAFSPAAASTLAVRDHQVRYLGEARSGAPLYMTCGVLSIGEADARLVQVLRHSSSGEPCATFVTDVAHVTAQEGRPFAWSKRTRDAAEGAKVAFPEIARARSLADGAVTPEASLARADALGLPAFARGVVQTSECDPFGRMRPDAIMGRLSQGAAHFFPDGFASAGTSRIGRVLLEGRILYLKPARVGDRVEVRSGVAEIGPKIQRFVQWVIDPSSGEAIASGMVMGASFDLDARKIVALPETVREKLQAQLTPGLGF